MRQIFVDLDGVLADFDGHHEQLFGHRPDRQADPPDFWKKIEENKTFFRTMPPMPGAEKLWWDLHRYGTPTILTGLPLIDGVDVQKREWVEERFGATTAASMICTRSKQKREHGKPGDLLIDDWAKYRHLWEEMGGVFILHTDIDDSLAKVRLYFL